MLGLGEQADREEPDGKREFAGVEDGVNCRGHLPTATMALRQRAGWLSGIAATTAEAAGPLQPTWVGEGLHTLGLGVILPQDVRRLRGTRAPIR